MSAADPDEITRGIADLVGESGLVMGIDTSAHLIGLAKQNFSTIKNLSFEVADISSYSPDRKYDVVTSARVLQWLSNPEEVLIRMRHLLKKVVASPFLITTMRKSNLIRNYLVV